MKLVSSLPAILRYENRAAQKPSMAPAKMKTGCGLVIK